MRDGAYLKRLGADLERWRADGAVTPDQAERLLDDARRRADEGKSSPAAIAAALGAVLFGLGLITFIAANWGAMAKSARMLSALALIWLTFGGAIIAFERKASWAGHAFALCGALALGAGISLIGQIYNIDGTASALLLLWSLGALATAIAFRATPVLVLYVILAFLWYLADQPDEIFVWSLFGAAGERLWSWRELGVAYLPLWFAGAFLGRRVDSGAAMHLSGLGLLIWAALGLNHALWLDGRDHWFTYGLALAGASAAAGAIAALLHGRFRERAASIALAWSAAGVFAGVLISELDLWDKHKRLEEMGFAAAILALSAWAIAWGEAPGRRGVRGFAVALFAFECFYVYGALFEGLLDTALFLLGGGALLLALAFGLRRLARGKASA